MFAAARVNVISIIVLVFATACAMGPRTEPAGVVEVGKLRVTIDDGWYRVPGDQTPEAKALTRVLTREGADKDRLYIISGIDQGDTLFKVGYAAFNPGMSADDIAGMITGSLEAVFAGADIEATSIKEHGYTGIPGVQLEFAGVAPNGQRGIAGGFEVDERLYAVIFVAETPASYERHRETAQQSIDSALYAIRTIRRN